MKRVKYIDIARAFAIIFIVVGHTLVHSANCSIVYKIIYGFHVPLFFIISGYTFNIKEDEKFFDFIKKKGMRILVPYFIWALLFLIPYMVLGNGVNSSIGSTASFDVKDMIFNVFYGNGNNGMLRQNSALWFLPALFSMEVFYYKIYQQV